MDSGKYECSVNTMPKISHVVELVVEDPMDIIMQDSPYTKSTMTPLKRRNNEMPLSEEDDQYPGPSAMAVISGPDTHHDSSGSTIGWSAGYPTSPLHLHHFTGRRRARCSLPGTGRASPWSQRRCQVSPPPGCLSPTSPHKTQDNILAARILQHLLQSGSWLRKVC